MSKEFSPIESRGGLIAPTADSSAPLPDHLAGLVDPEWALWRCVCLRGAGFPVTQVLELAAPECAAAADALISAEAEVVRAKNALLQAINGRLSLANDEQRVALLKLKRAIKKNQVPDASPTTTTVSTELEAYLLAREHVRRVQSDFEHAYQSEASQVSRAIGTIACDERFREAITWQNRHAMQTGIASLTQPSSESTPSTSNRRKHEALAANYLQRYCTKNDTIGFFGPFGLARLTSKGEAMKVHVGKDFLAKRSVYFETWCIDALAEKLLQEKHLRPWVAPRRLPQIHMEGTTLSLPFSKPVQLSRDEAAVLSACDGIHTAKELALDLIGKTSNSLNSEQEVYTVLEQLHAMKRISWSLEMPADGAHPEKVLRQMLEGIDDTQLREECLAMLNTLEAARDGVARAAGNAEKLDAALAHLEATFSELTGRDASRSAGKAYAARTLVYEDCLCAIDVELGPDFLLAFSEPLTLLLISARWFTYQTATIYRQALRDAFHEMVEHTGSRTIDFSSFWLWVQPLLIDEEVMPVKALMTDFQQRWLHILDISEEQHSKAFTSDELLLDVLTTFDAPGPGWRAACYHSPDVLIQASGAEAIREGDYQIILGELHIAMNTLQASAFLEQHPYRDGILRDAALDIPEPRMLPVMSRRSFPISRGRPALITSKDYRLVYAPDAYTIPDSRTLPISALVVEQWGEDLVVRTRDGQLCFDIIEVFAEFLSWMVSSCFKIVCPGKHTPRVTIDRLVMIRESWRFAPLEIPFADEKDAAARFIAARRWMQLHKLPRFVFVKMPDEPKPCFIDFDSPIYVDSLAKLVRQATNVHPPEPSIQVSEMLPAPNEVWLPDAEGRRYTSELRFVAVDLPRPARDW
ncbi:MAG TPA: lantibiotic dehydratase [Ktedonobacteraceae bacterium]|nr:lantibiotic dehydratase [Ktedonobacteraceae bacterium]